MITVKVGTLDITQTIESERKEMTTGIIGKIDIETIIVKIPRLLTWEAVTLIFEIAAVEMNHREKQGTDIIQTEIELLTVETLDR